MRGLKAGQLGAGSIVLRDSQAVGPEGKRGHMDRLTSAKGEGGQSTDWRGVSINQKPRRYSVTRKDLSQKKKGVKPWRAMRQRWRK